MIKSRQHSRLPFSRLGEHMAKARCNIRATLVFSAALFAIAFALSFCVPSAALADEVIEQDQQATQLDHPDETDQALLVADDEAGLPTEPGDDNAIVADGQVQFDAIGSVASAEGFKPCSSGELASDSHTDPAPSGVADADSRPEASQASTVTADDAASLPIDGNAAGTSEDGQAPASATIVNEVVREDALQCEAPHMAPAAMCASPDCEPAVDDTPTQGSSPVEGDNDTDMPAGEPIDVPGLPAPAPGSGNPAQAEPLAPPGQSSHAGPHFAQCAIIASGLPPGDCSLSSPTTIRAPGQELPGHRGASRCRSPSCA